MNRNSRSPLGIDVLVVWLLGMTLLLSSAQGQTAVYVTNQQTNTVSKIDAKTNKVVATIHVGNFPYGVAVSPDGNSVWVANSTDNTISIIDAATNTVIDTIPAGSTPDNVSFTPDGKYAYVADTGFAVSVIDTSTHEIVDTINMPTLVNWVTVSPDGTLAYATLLRGTSVVVIDTATNTIIGSIAVQYDPLIAAFTPDGARAYVTDLGANTVSVIDTATAKVTDTINVGNSPAGVAITPDGTRVYVTNSFESNSVSVIATASNKITATIPVGVSPEGIAISPDGTRAYVVNFASQTVSVIDTATNTVIARIGGLSFPNWIAIAPAFRTRTSLKSSLNPSIYGQKVTFTATVKSSGPTPSTGRVKFMWGDNTIGIRALDSHGVATLTRSLNAGRYPLVAVYSGDAHNLSSKSPVLNQIVRETTSQATLTSSQNPSMHGQAVSFIATITSPTVTATGPVTFTAGKTLLGTAQLRGGKATLTISSLFVGWTKVTATYYGDSNIAKSSASVIQTVQ